MPYVALAVNKLATGP